MSEIVFILGAGASRLAGGPLMTDFWDKAGIFFKKDTNGRIDPDYELVKRARSKLQSTHSKSRLVVSNLEEVYGAFEMAKLIGYLGDLEKEDVDKLPTAMKKVIVKTIESSISFPRLNGNTLAPRPYHDFTEMIMELANGNDKRVSVITFNYDIGLDCAVVQHPKAINYRLDGVPDIANAIDLLKLHGSLNWGFCQECDALIPWNVRDILANFDPFPRTGNEIKISISGSFAHFPHNKAHNVTGPIIVPPTWNKTHDYQQLASVWRAAALTLQEATNIIVCGYSFPNTDQFFHKLYALGSTGEAIVAKFLVYDPDPKVEAHYKDILGPGIEDFHFKKMTFDEMITDLRSEYGLSSRNKPVSALGYVDRFPTRPDWA